MAEHPRTADARDHDDSAIIDDAVAQGTAGVTGGSGSNLAEDVGTRNDLTRAVDDPEAMTRPEKSDDIASDQARPSSRGPDRQ